MLIQNETRLKHKHEHESPVLHPTHPEYKLTCRVAHITYMSYGSKSMRVRSYRSGADMAPMSYGSTIDLTDNQCTTMCEPFGSRGNIYGSYIV